MKIKYHQIQRVLGNHLILYNDRVYVVREDMALKPETITLLDKGLSEDDFYEIVQDTRTALGCN